MTSNVPIGFQSMEPDQFLLWWFRNAEVHGLAGDYDALYSRYFRDPQAIPYVWRHYRKRYETLKTIAAPGRRILDVGCGIGTEAMWAALRGAHSVGIGLHSWSLSVARKRLAILHSEMGTSLPCEFRYQNLLSIDEQDIFDAIFLRETFHHLEPRLLVVDKLATLLKPGGHIVIEETNGLNPLIQLKYLMIRGLRTVLIKRDPQTGAKYLFGNERITTGYMLNRYFQPYGIRGRLEYFRFLPTRLARWKWFATVIGALEPAIQNWPLFRPLCLHYAWHGTKPVTGIARSLTLNARSSASLGLRPKPRSAAQCHIQTDPGCRAWCVPEPVIYINRRSCRNHTISECHARACWLSGQKSRHIGIRQRRILERDRTAVRRCDGSAAEVIRAGKLGYPHTNLPLPDSVGKQEMALYIISW